MKPSVSSLSSLFAVLVTSLSSAQASSSPQDALLRPEIRGGRGARGDRTLHVRYDVGQGRVTSVRASNGTERGSPPCFDNSEIVLPEDPQYAVAHAGEELQNWGTKSCPGASRLRSFTICYRSEALDISRGGPGATFSIGLQQGSRGFGRPGTEVWRGTFTGLPSRGAPASQDVVYDHNGQPFLTRADEPIVFLTVDFGVDPLPLTDGNIGWSFLQLDGHSGPALVWAPKTSVGTSDAMDVYFPGPPAAANYVGTFNFGGCARSLCPDVATCLPCANMWIQLDEIANNEVASSAILEGNGVNRSILREIFPARLGRTWSGVIDISNEPIGFTTTLLHTSASDITPIRTRWGEILVDPRQRLTPPLPGLGGYVSPIPADVSMVGFTLYMQGSVLFGGVPGYLTNALRIRVGY